MSNTSTSLLFIPDITGFTRFVNTTEITHSQHIISELLELIIDANTMNLKVSEVEGDAVLFYKQNYVPDLDSILAQCRKMFLDFHHHLKKYETERICHCGACTGAADLSLKIVVHGGEIGFTNIKKQIKPFGADLVLAHRLLKNSVPEKEYVLFTRSFFDAIAAEAYQKTDWVAFKPGSETYPDIGEIPFQYTAMSALHDHLPAVEKPPLPDKVKHPWKISLKIERPIEEVFDILIDLEKRLLWNKGINDLEYEKAKVNRVGTRHRCVFDANHADFTTVTNDFGTHRRVYGEKVDNVPIARSLMLYYILEEADSGTDLTVEIHFKPLPLVGWVLGPSLKKKMVPPLERSLQNLKALCENDDAYDAMSER